MLKDWIDAIRRNPKLALATVPLIAGVVFLQVRLDDPETGRRQKAIEPFKQDSFLGKGGAFLPGEYILGAMSGFRQVIAGLLWVRSDSFFHSGNYDAILPLLRLITWLDPNWIDVYATGAWHLMYNFTDTDQRSDRRYLPPGIALLGECIANNPTVYDCYKEMGWNNYDKIKDFAAAVEAYEAGFKTKNADVTQIVHMLAHSLEKTGRVDESIAMWLKAVELHEKAAKDPATPKDKVITHQQGAKSAQKNASLLQIRKAVRVKDTQPAIDADLKVKVTRVRPRVIEVEGTWNQYGSLTDQFDAGVFDEDGRGNKVLKIGTGIIQSGPRDGGRMDVRLHNTGYERPKNVTFDFTVDPKLTIMQDALIIKGGKRVAKGSAMIVQKTAVANSNAERASIYVFSTDEALSVRPVPLEKALAGGATISPEGMRQLVTFAYPRAFSTTKKFYTLDEAKGEFARLKTDSLKVQELSKAGIHIAQGDLQLPGRFKREIDMSKDPGMYSFAAPTYDLVISFNPRNAPDYIQDRIGWNGEGLTDKKWIDDKFVPGLRMLRVPIPLTREQLVGDGKEEREVIFDSTKG